MCTNNGAPNRPATKPSVGNTGTKLPQLPTNQLAANATISSPITLPGRRSSATIPAPKKAQPDRHVQQVALVDAVADAHPLAAQRPHKRRAAQRDQHPPPPRHRLGSCDCPGPRLWPAPSSSAASAAPERSALARNPATGLELTRVP